MLVDDVRELLDALDASRRELSEANAERVADALDAIMLRDDAPPAPPPPAEAEAEATDATG